MRVYRILWMVLCTLFLTVFSYAQDRHYGTGWKPDPRATETFVRTLNPQYKSQVSTLIALDNNDDALLYRGLVPCLKDAGVNGWLKERNGVYVIKAYNQGQVGSCVGNALACVLSTLNAVQIFNKGEPYDFKAMHSADGMYGLAREAAGMLRTGDGCTGSGAAKAASTLGSLYCIDYGDTDLTTNTPNRAREYGKNGVGQKLKDAAKDRKVLSVTRVTTASEAWSLIGNGYPIVVCSSQGFTSTRNADGVCQPSGTWYHAMAVVGRRFHNNAKLFLIMNSWGDNWAKGPYWEDMPEGSFWITEQIMNKMLSMQDSFAYSDLDGFPLRPIPNFGSKEFLTQHIFYKEGSINDAKRSRSGFITSICGFDGGISKSTAPSNTRAFEGAYASNAILRTERRYKSLRQWFCSI